MSTDYNNGIYMDAVPMDFGKATGLSILNKSDKTVVYNLTIDPTSVYEGANDELVDGVLEENLNNTTVTIKKISKKFLIVSKTAAKRLKNLEVQGLISIKSQGRFKTLYVTEKGKTILNKKEII